MARGGYRPGAGRPRLTEAEKAERAALKAAGIAKKPAAKKVKKPAKAAAKAAEPSSPSSELAAIGEDAPAGMSPLDYMLHVMRSGDADPARRDRMAIAAAPFMHPRREPVGEGKREKAADDARKAVGSSRFAAAVPPKLVAAGGKKV